MSKVDALHPSRDKLESFFHGTLPEEERQVIEDHVAQCDVCCDILRTTPHDPFAQRIHAALSTMHDPSPSPALPNNFNAGVPAELREHPRYRILRRLGQGGMGVVYQAEHRLMERPVALKVIHGRLLSNEIAVERFRLEVKAAARLSHRNIVVAYDAEQAGNLHFLVMEYLDGVSLTEIVERRGPLSLLHACNFVLQAAHGLQHAFERGMVHRDIKPHNLLRTSRGIIKILDFGLARFATETEPSGDGGLTEDFATLGTPDYIAPEQAHDSKRADIRSDIYSLGCTLYYLLAGQVPFPKGTALDKVIAHSERQPTPLADLRSDLPDEVVQIVERMMAKDPAARFQTPAAVVAALRPYGKPDFDRTKPDEGDSVPRGATLAGDQTLSIPAAKSVSQNEPPPRELLVQPPATATQSARAKVRGRTWTARYRTPLIAGGAALAFFAAIYVAINLGSSDPEENRRPVVIAPPPLRQTTAAPHNEAWINLLSQIDLDSDVVAGAWEMTAEGLRAEPVEGARLTLPYEPTREYDFEVSFTRRTGTQSIALLFVDGDASASYDIDGWGEHLVGIQNIDGQSMNENRTAASRIALVNGQTYTATIRVRRERVDALLDGQLITTYLGDGSNLSMLALWRTPRPTLGIGAYDSETLFHRIRVRNISN
ncbi:protein kinase [Blastopirellula sp. J2-11]|uniref:serine/threonine-protein kinase n=1 Tax=Blastopirellula sp. J2-11 TaxID=2943192 RepID=UPI0021C730EC|nr:serine/threonine-protein kinase [Blastopirellula sp. J2-11]UUO06948.1 protein kinase [Blastopirellula sp. J2-11]